jgi:methylated-DNA-protein-cysteine methyltransferase related protein
MYSNQKPTIAHKQRSQVHTFPERVVAIARSIPVGKVTTYGRIARAAGGGIMSAQSITSILARAYDNGILDIPFHRIVYANGTIWIDTVHESKRMKLYKKERIAIDKKGKVIDFRTKLYLSEYE